MNDQVGEQDRKFHMSPFLIPILLMVFYIVIKTLQKKMRGKEPVEQRLWRKFAFSFSDMFKDMHVEEKELLKQTYENTVVNTKPSLIKHRFSPSEKLNKQGKKVSDLSDSQVSERKKVNFALELNQTHEIPYYSKNFLNE